MNVGGRVLQVPAAADRASQRQLYQQVKALRPISFQPEVIQQRIRATLQAEPETKALRTDIKSCFATIPQGALQEEIEKLSLAADLQQSLLNVFHAVEKGVPTGSPLSPWLAEQVLRLVDQKMAAFSYFRYADDICVLGNNGTCQQALATLTDTLAPLGMTLNPQKTKIVAGRDLEFLGRSYQETEDVQLIEVDLGGDSLGLPNNKHVFFRVNLNGKPYAEPEGNPVYSLSTLFNKILSQPTPYILEMLMLRPECSNPELAKIIAEPDSILDSKVPSGLHGKTWRHYVNRVKPAVARGGELPIGEAGEVFRWLYLENTILKTGKLPRDYSANEEEWTELLAALEAGEFNPYHKQIKRLFKEEDALRRQPPASLPEEKQAIELSIS